MAAPAVQQQEQEQPPPPQQQQQQHKQPLLLQSGTAPAQQQQSSEQGVGEAPLPPTAVEDPATASSEESAASGQSPARKPAAAPALHPVPLPRRAHSARSAGTSILICGGFTHGGRRIPDSNAYELRLVSQAGASNEN